MRRDKPRARTQQRGEASFDPRLQIVRDGPSLTEGLALNRAGLTPGSRAAIIAANQAYQPLKLRCAPTPPDPLIFQRCLDPQPAPSAPPPGAETTTALDNNY